MFELIRNEPNQLVLHMEELRRHGEVSVVLYGAGYCGHEAMKLMREYGISIMAVCDDGRVGQEIDGMEITDIKEIIPVDNMKIFITSGFYDVMKNTLRNLGLIQYYQELDFGRFEQEKETYDFFRKNREKLENAYSLMGDAASKELFMRLVQYRISRNPDYLKGMWEHTPQYYPDEPDLREAYAKEFEGHIFMDLGAYDGDSIQGFLRYTGGRFSGIYAVEASEKNFSMLQKNSRDLHPVEMYKIGISDSHGMVPFAISEAKNSYASVDGDTLLEVDSVDHLLAGRPVTFIKMDIEGAEYEAIRGARDTIRKWCPVMAVSVYHLTEDLYRLQLEIEKTAPGKYDYYLRHYSPTVIETVLYAVPKR